MYTVIDFQLPENVKLNCNFLIIKKKEMSNINIITV